MEKGKTEKLLQDFQSKEAFAKLVVREDHVSFGIRPALHALAEDLPVR